MTTFRIAGPFQPLETFAFGLRGIVATPASDDAVNGWGEPFKTPQGDPIEPGTPNGPNPQTVLKEAKEIGQQWKEKRKPYLAGNIEWRGDNGEVLTWVGSPTRYFDFVPHFDSTNTGEIWPGQTTWQNPADPSNPTPALNNVTAYNTVGRVTNSGQFVDEFFWLDTGTVFRKGAAYFDVGGPNRIMGAALTTLPDNTTWLYFVYAQAAGYNNADILARVQVPFDFDSPAVEQLDVQTYGLTPTLLNGNRWNHVNTSPWFFSGSGRKGAAIRKFQVNIQGVFTPIAHLMQINIANDGAAQFIDSGVVQTSKADALISFEKQFLSSEPAGPNTINHYVNNQDNTSTYGGQTTLAVDWIGENMVTAEVYTSGTITWSDQHFYREIIDTATGLPAPNPIPTEDFQGAYLDTLTEELRFGAGGLPNIIVNTRNVTASMNGLTTASPPDERATTYGAAVETQIKYMDLRYGILHIKQTGNNTPIDIELEQESRADSYARERLYVDGFVVATLFDEFQSDYLYYPASSDPITLPHVYDPVFGDTNPPDPTVPTVSGQFFKGVFWVPQGSLPPYESVYYTQPLDWLRIAFAAAVAVSPTGEHVLASFPVWPEREVEDIDRGTWLDNREFHAAMYGLVPLSENQLIELTGATGANFRLHLAGSAGK